LWVRTLLRQGVLDTTLCDEVCQWLAEGQWFSLCTLVSSTNKTDCHDIAEILLKVALSTINQPSKVYYIYVLYKFCNPCIWSHELSSFFSDGHRLIRYIPVGNNCEKKGGYSHGRRILWWTIYLSQTLELVETKIILQCMYMYEVVPTVKNTEWNVQTETISVFVFVYIMCSLNAATFGRTLLELWSHNSSEQTNDDITNKLEDKDFILFDFRILTFVVIM
jgi:hypothetical protein